MKKKCNKCEKVYPKTLDYFFQQKTRQKNKNGISIYYGFKHICKKCHSENTKISRQKARCKELNCDLKDYEKRRWEEYSKKRIKYPEINHLPTNVRTTLRRWIDKGYIFTTYEQYKLDCSLNISLNRRKYTYDKTKIVDKKLQNRSQIINLTDAYIAYTMGFKVSEVPKEIIETKRLLIKLKRELKTI